MAEQPSISVPGSIDPGASAGGFWGSSRISARTALVAAAAAACMVFTLGSGQFGLPALPEFDGSILAQPSSIVALLVIAVMLAISALVGTIIARNIHFDAGLFAASFGLIVISLRCGTIQSVLFETDGSQLTYVRLIFELLIFAAFFVGIWWVLCRAHGKPPMGPPETKLLGNLTATLSQAVTTGVVLMILCQSEAKNQCLASVGIASLVGTLLAYKYSPAEPSIWFWMGPLLTGVIGYALAAMGQDSNLNIGLPTGTVAALARPLPLDYASVGIAGAILGYWMSTAEPAAE
jgi:hypothetical protein